MDERRFITLKEAIENAGLQEKIMIWGATERSCGIVSLFEKWGFTVKGYIDREYEKIQQFNGYKVYGKEQLQLEQYFVFVSLKTTNADILNDLELFGYREFVNFWYPNKLIRLDGTTDYRDLYGNELITSNNVPINVGLRNGGKIIISSTGLDQTTKVTSEGDSLVIVGKSVAFGKNVVISSTNGEIAIGDGCRFDSFIKLRVSSNGKINLGEKCTLQRDCAFVASFGARLILGRDCMVSYYVLMRAGNSHNIIDLDTGINLDDNDNRDVVLGEHVWVGMRVTLLNGVEIGSGSTVGANSFVCKRKFPSNCCLGGNPAKIIREHTAWLRDGVRMHKDLDDYSEFIFDE